MTRTAIVTGAGSGIGREFVREIAARCPRIEEIWVTGRREDRLLSLAGEYGMRIRPMRLDLTEERDLDYLSAVLRTERPGVSLLINAAGMGFIGTMEDIPLSGHRDTIRLNVEALTEVTLRVLPYMPRGGRIINLSSGSAFMPQPGFGVYAAGKSYVLSFSRALHAELRERGISVTAVCPGPVDTEFFRTAERHHAMASYKKYFMTSPERVVREALRDAAKRREVSVCTVSMKLFRIAAKMLPQGLLLRILYGSRGGIGKLRSGSTERDRSPERDGNPEKDRSPEGNRDPE